VKHKSSRISDLGNAVVLYSENVSFSFIKYLATLLLTMSKPCTRWSPAEQISLRRLIATWPSPMLDVSQPTELTPPQDSIWTWQQLLRLDLPLLMSIYPYFTYSSIITFSFIGTRNIPSVTKTGWIYKNNAMQCKLKQQVRHDNCCTILTASLTNGALGYNLMTSHMVNT